MKEFTRDEINNWRETFTSRGYPKKQASLDGRVIGYFEMPRNLFQGIPNGLFRMTGKPQDGYLIGVSDDVPLGIQPHFAISEHDEFMVYGLDDLDRTLHSEQNMLNILNGSNLRPIYLDNKLALYNHLIINAKDSLDKWGFTEKDYAGFVRAFNYLKILS